MDLSFVELDPARLRVYPLASHFAEKLHAYTRPHEQQTSALYGTHLVPETGPPAPADWSAPFAALAAQTGLTPSDLDTWTGRLAIFWSAALTSQRAPK